VKLSVVVPAFNEERGLEKCLRSVLAAAVEDSEIILVDDGSTDDTRKVVRDLAVEDSRVRLLRHAEGANRGVAATRNLGLAEARGTYIAFLDADDYCEATRFAVCLPLLESSADLDGVLVPVQVHFDDTNDGGARDFLPAILDHDPSIASDAFAIATLTGRSGFHISNLLFRSGLLNRSGVFDPRRKLGEEDLDLWLRMALAGRFASVSRGVPQVHYRRHAGNNWQPSMQQSFRDLNVLAGVLEWARGKEFVPQQDVAHLARAFDDKWQHCMNVSRDLRLRREGLMATLLAASTRPALIQRRVFWGNLWRTLIPWNVAARR